MRRPRGRSLVPCTTGDMSHHQSHKHWAAGRQGAPGAAPEPGPVERNDAAGRARGQRACNQAPGEGAAAEAVDEHHGAVARRAAAALPAPAPRRAQRRPLTRS